MEGRSWPWKKKSSDKITNEKPVVGNESTKVCSLSYLASLENQEKCKNTNYVQITMDSYTHMSKMEEQVKLFESEVKDLKEKLTLAQSEIKTKESLILQHAKVAEEAVSGWEKADAETLALKRQLESVTLSKLTAEDRAWRLDDALKECTRQIRIVKDESDHKLQDMILTETIHFEQIKSKLEKKIEDLNHGLSRRISDNAALTRSLQERSEMIVMISEEKSKAEAEVEKLKTNVELGEKEISCLKYDVHVASKELEIRNEEKNMSLRSAENANKQCLEGVKKIAKLEAECQRLKGLLRKKLPGPAAMSQMKIEVESLGNEFNDHRVNKVDGDYKKLEECKRENVYLTKRVLDMEEEIQRLNSELQVSRNVCAKTLGKLKILEEQFAKSNIRNVSECLSSVTSVSEDGFDDEEGSSSNSKARVSNRLELMDDFLEVEKLAANESDEITTRAFDQVLSVLRSRIEKIFESQEGISVEKIVEAARVSIQESSLKKGLYLFKVCDDETLLEKHVLSSQIEESEDHHHRVDESDDSSCKSLLKEVEDLKLEKEKIVLELTGCLENLECVTGSYKSLEIQTKDLQGKVKCLEEETERVELAFSMEKKGHEETLAKCKDLQENMQRNESCKKCLSSKLQPNQEKDIASATEKLAACQEAIHLLSQQLQSLQPQSQTNHHNPKSQVPEKKLQRQKTSETLDDLLPRSLRHTGNPTVHAIIKSSSVSSSSKEDNEKLTRGLGRFFSSKSKNN